MNDVVLSIDSVSKRFGSVDAVKSVSIDIDQREFLALLGPSGSGKTTLLRIIAGLENTDTGSVRINGRDVTHEPPYARGIGMVFQDFMLFPHKRVGENITFPLRMQGLPRSEQDERLKWVVELLHLQGLEERYPNQLSGGQQQRVALARGLIARPAMLLLDEPLANLDRELRKEMEVEIRRYQLELGIPFIYVTHNQEEALTMSDRIVVMNGGVFEQVADKLDVYQNPSTRFVAGFVGHSNRFQGSLVSVASDDGLLDWNGLPIRVPLPNGAGSGSRVDYFVKCERFRVDFSDAAGEGAETNVIRGHIRDVIFKGAGIDYQVVAENGHELTISGRTATEGSHAGRAINIVWQRDDGNCFLVEGSHS